MTMGTAATMMAIAEAMGLTLPGASSIPAADADHPRMCDAVRAAHRRDGVGGPDARARSSTRLRSRTPSRCTWRWAARPTPSSMSWRWRGAPASRCRSSEFDQISRTVPVIANMRPSGELPDGGLLLRRRPARADEGAARQLLDRTCLTVTGKTLAENIARAEVHQRDVIRPLDKADLRRRARPPCCAATSPRAARHEAVGRRDAPAQASRPGARVRRLQPHGERDRARRSRRHARSRAGAARTPGRRADPACPSGACCRSRASW